MSFLLEGLGCSVQLASEPFFRCHFFPMYRQPSAVQRAAFAFDLLYNTQCSFEGKQAGILLSSCCSTNLWPDYHYWDYCFLSRCIPLSNCIATLFPMLCLLAMLQLIQRPRKTCVIFVLGWELMRGVSQHWLGAVLGYWKSQQYFRILLSDQELETWAVVPVYAEVGRFPA